MTSVRPEADVERRVRGRHLGQEEFGRLDFVGATGPRESLPQTTWLRSLGARRFVFRSNTDAVRPNRGRASACSPTWCATAPWQVRLTRPTEAPRVQVWLVLHKEPAR